MPDHATPPTSVPAGPSEADRLGGAIGEHLFDVFGEMDFEFGGQKYELVGGEEFPAAIGWACDPYALILRRESDGALFEVELGATVYPVVPKAPLGEEALPLGTGDTT